jgi:hypothetical protein
MDAMTAPVNQDALTWDAKKRKPREPKPGEEVWRVTNADGRAQHCELRDCSKSGGGWHVVILEDGELLVSSRWEREDQARRAAGYMGDDLRRTGWSDVPKTVKGAGPAVTFGDHPSADGV